MNDFDGKKKARRRALRAAQAVTLGLAVATGGAGCFGSHGRDRRAPPVEEADAATLADAAIGDAGIDGGDALLCDLEGDWMAYQECCDAHGWDPEWGCFAWGPFVPPAESAHAEAA